MSKYAEIKAAAEAEFTSYEDAEAASSALTAYIFEVRSVKARFEAMNCEFEDSVLDNARDAGLSENDIEFWQYAISDAELNA